jgi:general secretion pathway protein K
MLFGESLSLVSAANILSDRPLSGFADREEFLSHPELSNISLSNSAINSIKFNSDFYQLTVKVKNFEYPFVLNSYLQVLDSGRVRVVKRSQGVF